MSQRPVYFDCDTGIDDALALAYLMASPEIELVGIGTVSGNIDARTAARNTLDLLAMGGVHTVPVAVGAMDPLTHPFHGGVPHIHGHNGVGDVELPHTDTRPVAESASDLAPRKALNPKKCDLLTFWKREIPPRRRLGRRSEYRWYHAARPSKQSGSNRLRHRSRKRSILAGHSLRDPQPETLKFRSPR